jgi:hypothetical protein
MIQEIGENIIFPTGHVFHKSFTRSYVGLTVINARRKLSKYYTHGQQDMILRYLKSKGLLQP